MAASLIIYAVISAGVSGGLYVFVCLLGKLAVLPLIEKIRFQSPWLAGGFVCGLNLLVTYLLVEIFEISGFGMMNGVNFVLFFLAVLFAMFCWKTISLFYKGSIRNRIIAASAGSSSYIFLGIYTWQVSAGMDSESCAGFLMVFLLLFTMIGFMTCFAVMAFSGGERNLT
ncbi:hypothetical protein LRR81_09185 [Metabacillus sp. GX 13764]|uniref:hypothetical protein n=1 Tax=Metabacillus kandeliae TaxID=2900151 RepID=UPI001E34D5FE|nr:hypothetical protein [Metabacillus kandeliae]MCD7034409.1 hypothetical protein [Metabacillus kandeliae]